MRVKLRIDGVDKEFDSCYTPIKVELNDYEKKTLIRDLKTIRKGHTFGSFPSSFTKEDINNYMKDGD